MSEFWNPLVPTNFDVDMSGVWTGATALPEAQQIPQISAIPRWTSAYSRVLALEREYAKECHDVQSMDNDLRVMHIRVIGWSYVHATGTTWRDSLKEWVDSCEDSDTVVDLGRHLCQFFLRPFRKSKGSTPADSTPPSRSSFDRRVAAISRGLVPTPANYSEAKRRAHERDNDQCVFTKKFAFSSPLYDFGTKEETVQGILTGALTLPKRNTLEGLLRAPRSAQPCSLECAHILSELTESKSDTNGHKTGWATTLWGILEYFGQGNLLHELKGPKVHRLENIISMSHDFHDRFDSLSLWLEPVAGQEQQYRIRGPMEYTLAIGVYSEDGTVKFTTPDERLYPLPSPQYIALHAAACKIACMSGAADHFEKIDRALNEDGVLAEDGHQMYVLADRLQRVMTVR
ncbi:hypothetical protein BD626DRAFT_545011 [Schizophyllum amplum]|uniref:Uncharacterized protein n=1 Tax=Schizophyllum amplum TaxID=97359 RepID=A0A550CS61_9AGAR|nr:hypothetical protein BD626DRAFT_545011 [Auriculariopsis ampla]